MGVVFRVCLIAVAALLTGPVLADNSQSKHNGNSSQSVTGGAPDQAAPDPGDDGTIINPDGDDGDANSPDDDGSDDGDSPDDSGGDQDLPATNPV